jgi:predicted nucleic acid-binding protein
MYTLDASIFVRDLNPREPNHALCRELLEQLAAQRIPIIASLLLLVEVAGTLSRELRDPMRGRMAMTNIFVFLIIRRLADRLFRD